MAEGSTNITLLVEGMDCSNCAMGITKSLQKKGMEQVHVDFATGEANFNLPASSQLKTAIDTIQELGYKVVDQKYQEDKAGKLSPIEKRFLLTLPFTLVLFLSHMLLPHTFWINQPFVQLILCIPVFITGLLQFGKSAFGSLKAGVPNMDVLIFIGSTAAFVYSIMAMYLYAGSHEVHKFLFFETCATIICLVLLGNVLEHRSVKQTTSAIKDLSSMQVQTAKMVGLQFGKETITEVEYKDIHQGALLQVNSGDKVPVDGEIYSGEASINESMITGESVPVDKTPGSKVIGGTIVLNGNFRMRAEAVGKDTVLSRIIELVKKAQQDKPAIQKLGDKISAIFVPVVLAISILTFLVAVFGFHLEVKQALMNSIAVLVISCPCAMGLATPTAVMVGIGRAAKKGILIKGGSTLEALAGVKTMVFDKTGTLSTGQLKIKKIDLYENAQLDEVRSILFQLENHSSHPIAQSIVTELKGHVKEIRLNNIQEEQGSGMSAQTENGEQLYLGSYQRLSKYIHQNSHSIYLVKADKLIAAVELQDEMKSGVDGCIRQLEQNGVQTILLSGDSQEKVSGFAAQAGITRFFAEQHPEQKLAKIKELNNLQPTAMVGDGVNDAPALAEATVGISLGSATQVAIGSAQVVLLKPDNSQLIVDAYLISKHTLITIKQNLFWAFAYNVVAIPLAAFGMLNPMIGALSMAFSDVIVIGNSIRLKSKKLR